MRGIMGRFGVRTAGGVLAAVLLAGALTFAVGNALAGGGSGPLLGPAARAVVLGFVPGGRHGHACRGAGVPRWYTCAGPFRSRRTCDGDRGRHWAEKVTSCRRGNHWKDPERWYYGFR